MAMEMTMLLPNTMSKASSSSLVATPVLI